MSVTDARGRRVPDGGLARWLAAAAPRRATGHIAIALVSDPAMRVLNREYHGVDRPTDVLSFPTQIEHGYPVARSATASPSGRRATPGPPARQPRWGGKRVRRGGGPPSLGKAELWRAAPKRRGGEAPRPAIKDGAVTELLGDIAIARGVARRQAREQGHSVRTELRVLALHGLLHLLGYDHDTDQGEMQRMEERLRRRAGLPVGLIGRVHR